MPTTIGRNRRQYVINVRAEYTVCQKYDPELAEWSPVDPAEAWSVLETHRSARLVQADDQDAYMIVLGRETYELRKAPLRTP